MIWVIFTLHISLILLFLIYFLFFNRQHLKFSKSTKYKFLLIFIIAVFINFFYLKNYPFVAVGDEVRDGALDAMKITTGEISIIFGYGSYNAHGLIVPTFNSFFFRIFGSSVLSYRIPTALISTIDIFLLFFITTNLVGSTAGFWAALLLACSPLHMFYSRTETVVIFSSLITTILIYFSYRIIKYRQDFLYLALLIGFSFNFHASVKSVAVLLLPLLFIKILSFKKLTKIFFALFTSVFVIIIGFGPRLLNTTFNIFFNITRFDTHSADISSLLNKYFNSIKVIAFSPTVSHYFDHQPLLTIPLFILFLIGLIFLFKINRILFFLLVYLLLTIPFTNSAITDIVNADHRLMPLLSIISIIIGLAISGFINYLPKIPKLLFIAIIFIYIIDIAFNFFYQQKANINDYNNWREPKEYLSMHLIYLIQNNNLPKDIIIHTSVYNAKNYNYAHYQEQYRFFLPDGNISFVGEDYINDHTAVLSTNQSRSLHINCLELRNRLVCPLNDTGIFTIYY